MSKRTSLILAVVISTAAAQAPGPAWAGPLSPRTTVVQVRVPLADLDLSQDAGAETLLKRVRAAAAKACGPAVSGGVMMMDAARDRRHCRDQALARAVAQVDSPVVQAHYAATQPPKPVTVAEVRP